MREETNHYHDLFGKSLAIDYQKEAERWVEFVRENLREYDPEIVGHGISSTEPTDSFPYRHLRLSVTGANGKPIDLPSLAILHGGTITNGIYLVLASAKPILPEHIEVWTKVITTSGSQLAKAKTQKFHWEAVIGQLNEIGGNQHYSLKSRSKVGQLTLHSGRTPHTFYGTSTAPRFNSFSPEFCYPIIIKGTATGYDWTEASLQASRDANYMAAFLSIGWDSIWTIIHSPQPKGAAQLKIPRVALGMPQMYSKLRMYPRKRRSFPAWIPKAYKKINKDIALANALDTYHQGLLMQAEHPSFANLAFIASIETVGRKLAGTSIGNKARFIVGLKTIIKNKGTLKELADTYKPRSSTTHEAKLHCNESLLGYVSLPSIFNPSPSDLFAIGSLRRIKSVSRKVLIKQLRG